MKLKRTACAILLALSAAFAVTPACAVSIDDAAAPPMPCYPTAVTRSEDGSEIRKMYDLAPEDNPAGIPRSDFEQDGFHYTLTDLLKQELPENESRQHTETVNVESKSKDMASVLALLPQEREFITEDGLAGVLTLRLETVKVEAAGYTSATNSVNTTRTYPGLVNQDISSIPKSIQDKGCTLTLQSIDWQADADGHFTAAASYSGSTTSSYVKGYTVTADYTGTVSRIALNRTRYVAVFEGQPLEPHRADLNPGQSDGGVTAGTLLNFPWKAVLVPAGLVAALGAAVGIGLVYKKRHEENGGDGE